MHKTRNLFGAKRLKKDSGFLIFHYSFVQVAIAFLFCNRPFFVCMKKIIVDFQTNHQYTIIVKCLFISANEQYLSLIAILYSAVSITNNTVFMYHMETVFLYIYL